MTEFRLIPQGIKDLLTKWQLEDAHIGNLQKMRDRLAEGAELGTLALPDFTLHNERHSDNIVHLLIQLHSHFPLDDLTPYETYLLIGGIYLHDIGMYIGKDEFERDIEPNWHSVLPFCPDGKCDQPSNYDPVGKTSGEKIRELHNLISAYRIRKLSGEFGLDEQDRTYLMDIARGHRRVDLTADCECFRDLYRSQGTIRLSLLAGLVRLLDALDFENNRAPTGVFCDNALHFLQHPVALEHWLKHYFSTGCEITKETHSGNHELHGEVHFAVPRRLADGRDGQEFFEPLFQKHLDDANTSDLDIRQYPQQFTQELGVHRMQLELNIHRRGVKPLPSEINDAIVRSGATDSLQFIEWLRSRPALIQASSVKSPGSSDGSWLEELPDTEYFVSREPELCQFREALVSRDIKVILLRGLPEIGKEYLVSEGLRRAMRDEVVSPGRIRVIDCGQASTSGSLIQRLSSVLGVDLPSSQWDAVNEQDDVLDELTRSMQREEFIIVLTHFEHLLDRTSPNKGHRFPVRNYWLDHLLAYVLEKQHRSKLVITTTAEPLFVGSTTYMARITSPGSHQILGFDQEGTREFLVGKGIEPTRADLRIICGQLQGHPLALGWLTYMLNAGFTIEEIVELELVSWVDGLLGIIYELCRTEAKEVLECLSIHRRPIPIDALARLMGCLSVSERQALVGILHDLRSRSLVLRSRDHQSYSLHSIVRVFCYDKIEGERAKRYHKEAAEWYRRQDSRIGSERTREDIAYAIEAHYHFEKAGSHRSALKVLRRRIIPVWRRIDEQYYEPEVLRKCAEGHLDRIESLLDRIESLKMTAGYNPDIKYEYGVECARYANLALRALREEPSHVLNYLDKALECAPKYMRLYGTYVDALMRLEGANSHNIGDHFRKLETTLRQQLARDPRDPDLLHQLGWVLIKWADCVGNDVERKDLLRAAAQQFEESKPISPDDYFYRTWAQSNRELAKAERDTGQTKELLQCSLDILNEGLTKWPRSRVLVQDKATTLRHLNDLESDRETAICGYDEAIRELKNLQVKKERYRLRLARELALLYLAQARRAMEVNERFSLLSDAENVLRTVTGHSEWGSEDSLLLADVLIKLSEESGPREQELIQEAVGVLKEAVDSAPSNPRLVCEYAGALLREAYQAEKDIMKQIREAIQFVEEALGKTKSADLYYCLGQLYRRRAYVESGSRPRRWSYDKAQRCVERAIDLGKEEPDAYAELGRLFRERARKESGKHAYEKNITLAERKYKEALMFPDSEIPPWIYREAAIFYAQIWNYERAYTLLCRYFQRETNVYLRMKACDTYTHVVIQYARNLEEKDRNQLLKEALERCDESYPLLQDNELFLVSYARVLFELGYKKGAINHFSRVLDRYTKIGDDVLSWLDETEKICEGTEEQWPRAIVGAPGDAMVWSALGTFYKECLKDFQRAEKAYRNGLILDRNNVVLLNNLALLIMESGQHERFLEAAELLRKGCSISQGRFKWIHENLKKLKAMPEYHRQKNYHSRRK